MHLTVAALASGLSGCVSFSYLDSHQNRHVVGLIDAVLVDDGRPPTAKSVAVLGLSISAPPKPGLTLGYSRESVISVPAQSCIDLQEPGPCSARKVTHGDRPVNEGKDNS
jgi:hypothetical protein